MGLLNAFYCCCLRLFAGIGLLYPLANMHLSRRPRRKKVLSLAAAWLECDPKGITIDA